MMQSYIIHGLGSTPLPIINFTGTAVWVFHIQCIGTPNGIYFLVEATLVFGLTPKYVCMCVSRSLLCRYTVALSVSHYNTDVRVFCVL